MPLVDALLPEFDHEMTTTRKVLERVPDDKFDWKPHAKSMSLGELAHARREASDLGHRDADQVGDRPRRRCSSRRQRCRRRPSCLAAFDRNVAATRAALTGKTDGELMAPWSLKRGGKTIFSMPKAAVLRSFVLSHLIHHRAQLSVYLRLLDVPVPSMYGPSADEPSF